MIDEIAGADVVVTEPQQPTRATLGNLTMAALAATNGCTY